MPGPLPVSPDTALKLSRFLGVPVEHLMHMPRHVLLKKLAEMAAKENTRNEPEAGPQESPNGAANGQGSAADKPREDETP
jgi:plasmid maintenance system antidote protein VapI